MQSPENSVLVQALESLTKFAELEVKKRQTLLGCGIIDAVLALLCRKNEDVVKQPAVACLAATTEVTPAHPDMKKKELMDKMVALLSPNEKVQVQEEAAFTLANMAADFGNKSAMRTNGALLAICRALKVSDPDVQKQAALALSILFDDFANRAEIRYLKGLGDLVNLLGSEYHEIKENAVNCLLKCTEDNGNKIELFKIGELSKFVKALDSEPATLYPGILKCLANVLTHEGLAASLSEINGIVPLVKLAGADDIRTKINAELAISVAARDERNRHYFREAGALPLLIANLGHPSAKVVVTACIALATLAKNDMNQTEFIKLNFLDKLVRILHTADSVEIKRATLVALTSCCMNIKMRVSLKDQITHIIQSLDPNQYKENIGLLVDAADCINNLAEDAQNRLEIVRQDGVRLLLQALDLSDTKAQSIATLGLSRLLQDNLGRSAFLELNGMPKFIQLLSSNDINVQRHAAWAISSAAATESLAVQACGQGALEKLMTIARDTTKAGTKFANDTLEKLLMFHAPAKYWLRNTLAPENLIHDGFFDMGYVGAHVDVIPTFPTLSQLAQQPVDKSREVLLVNVKLDPSLAECVSSIRTLANLGTGSSNELLKTSLQSGDNSSSGNLQSLTSNTPNSASQAGNLNNAASLPTKAVLSAAVAPPKALTVEANLQAAVLGAGKSQLIVQVAGLVAAKMGGVFDPKKVHEIPVKTRIVQLKMEEKSNIIPIGKVDVGVWYHRALLFKALCDRMDIPCGLTRGEYNRAWNTVGIIKDELLRIFPAQLGSETCKSSAAMEDLQNVLAGFSLGEQVSCVVDLMFTPGKLLAIGTSEAETYMRIQ